MIARAGTYAPVARQREVHLAAVFGDGSTAAVHCLVHLQLHRGDDWPGVTLTAR